jgi:hypothetical protein
MADDKNKKILQQLHDEINNLQEVDDKGAELLRDLDADIHDLLERSGKEPIEVHAGIFQRLEQVVDHFGATHPEFATLISELLTALSSAGV